ncbi:MAG: UvrD-helicase domain-containing protein [Clostridia bacterium]|nr:UvrD-helicase domain-containing protein [Clostridia bacterium]
MTNWTEQQQAVIRSDAKEIICSASAGSGKTAVMIERVIRMLREGAAPESFLIVTFTTAAASEMKQKIRKTLTEYREERPLRRALEKLDLMEISTIHSFCQHLIRQEFQEAEADPFFSVCDQGRSAKLFSASFREACNSLQRENNGDYAFWRRCFDRKSSEEIVKQVYHFMQSLPDPAEWLAHACDDIPLRVDPGHEWFRTASEIVASKIREANLVLGRQLRMFDEPEHGEPYRAAWKADYELFHVKQLWADGEDVPEEALRAGFSRLPSWSRLNSLELDWKERYTGLRNRLKEIDGEIRPLIRPSEETVARDFGNMKASLQGLKVLTLRTAERFARRKAKKRLLDFSDLEHYALKILRSEKTGAAVRRRYPNVFVDECQDVSRVQDAIIQQLHAPEGNLFMVGDVKQSIYHFRLAEPALFQHRMEEYDRPDSEGQLLELQTNFRSRPEILETANRVFRDVMRRETAEMDYGDREKLIPGKPAEGFQPVYADVLRPGDGQSRLETMADYLCERFRELKEEGFDYKDFVILMPQVSRDGQKLADLLEERRVPVFFDSGGSFYEQEEVSCFLAVLAMVANPSRDDTLLTSLKNAPFFFTEEELAQIRLRCPDKDETFRHAFNLTRQEDSEIGIRCREAEERIQGWRRRASVVPMGEFVRWLCSESHAIAMAGVGPRRVAAVRNLRLLCRRAEEAQAAGVYTLRRFLSYVEEQAAGGDQRSAVPLAEGDNLVRIMTMHKSKGLQFPVVFCMGLDEKTGPRPESGVQLDAELGICLKYKKPEFRYSRNTAASVIFSWKKEQEQRAERIRLLYVAMTRAQQRMYLAAVGEDQVLWHAAAGENRVIAAENYMDWILPSLYDAEKLSTGYPQGQTYWKIRDLEVFSQSSVDKNDDSPQFREWLESLLSAEPVDEVWKELWKETPPEERLSKMQKRSVTALVKKAERDLAAAEEAEEEETAENKRDPNRFEMALKRTDTKRLPAFMAPPPEMRGAWRGSVIHRFLSLADLEKLRAVTGKPGPALAAIRDEMLSAGVFTAEEGKVLTPAALRTWFESSLGQRMLKSPEVRREWSFNLYRPEQRLLVQGIIDCAFREGDGWILVDYKTDRIDDEAEFVDTYRAQLEWYALALTELTGLPVRESWLYSLSKGKAYAAGGTEIPGEGKE